jgi:hypothetical protein
MGLESANYVLYSSKLEASQLVRIIQNLGGSENSDTSTGNREFSIQGERYWIDLQRLAQSQTGRPVIFIRVALCNPHDVGQHLKQLLTELFKIGDTVMTDTRSKLQWIEWNDKSWDQLWESYQHQQAEFKQTFGNYEAAISAGKVFENLRKLPGSESNANNV